MGKKSFIMLTFLFYTILALIIFVPTLIWASQFFKFSQRASDSYERLADTIANLKDGELQAMPLYIDKDTFIVGFSANSDRFEYYYMPISGKKELEFYLEKPVRKNLCETNKACICLCGEFDSYMKKEGYKLPQVCTSFLYCTPLENIDIIESRVYSFTTPKEYKGAEDFFGEPIEKFEWKNGFLFTRDIEIKGAHLDRNEGKVRSAYIEKYKDFVDVCFETPCITEEKKDIINVEQAIKEFNNFKEFHDGCLKKTDEYCGEFINNLPLQYTIYYDKDKAGFYLGKVSRKDNSMEIVKKNDEEVYFKSSVFNEQKEKYNSERIFENVVMQNKEGKIILGTGVEE